MTALVAVDPGETVLRVAAGEEPRDDVLLDVTLEPAACLQFWRVPGGALMQRRRARLARPVNPSTSGLRRMRASLHASSNAFLQWVGAQRIQLLPGDFVTRRKYANRDFSNIAAARIEAERIEPFRTNVYTSRIYSSGAANEDS